MADLLSQEEIDALLSATGEVAEETATPVGKHPADKARAYDFRHPEKISAAQKQTLEGIHKSFATILTSSFSTLQKTIVDVSLYFVEQMTYADFIMSLPTPSCTYTFNMKVGDNDPVTAIIDFSPNLAFSFVDRMFGGKGENYTPPNRELTTIERPIMQKVVDRTLLDLEKSWEQINILAATEYLDFQSNPEFLQIAIQSEIVAAVYFEVSSTGLTGMINLCYPFSLLEPILDLLNPTRMLSAKRKVVTGGPQLQTQLEKIPSEIRVQLGTTALTIRDFLSLQQGDVVTLDTRIHEPSVLFVGNRPKFLGRPGRSGQSLGIEILKPITPGEEDKYLLNY